MKQVIINHHQNILGSAMPPPMEMTLHVHNTDQNKLGIVKKQSMTERREDAGRGSESGYFSPQETIIERKLDDLENQCGMIIGIKQFIMENVEIMREVQSWCQQEEAPVRDQVKSLL